MKFFKITAAAMTVLAVAACATTPAAPRNVSAAEAAKVRAAIKETLRAPDSAKFQSVKAYAIANGETAYCVNLNAQNGFGGMTGFKPALANYGPNRAPIIWLDELAAYECNNLANGVSGRF